MSHRLETLWAFLIRDYQQETSYRLNFISQWSAIVLNILVWYFLARFAGDAMAARLEPYGGDFFSFLLVGVALWGYQSTAVNSLRGRIREAQTIGTLEALLVTSTPPNQLIVGSTLYDFVFMSLRVVAYLVLGFVFFDLDLEQANYVASMVVLVLSIAAFMGIGIMAGAFTMIFKKGDPVTWVFTTLAVPLGGVFYPVSVLPGPLQWLANLLPVTHSLEAMRRTLLEGASLAEVAPSLKALAVFALILFPTSLFLFRQSLRWAKARGSLVHY